MAKHISKHESENNSTRREFLKQFGFGAAAAGMAAPLLDNAYSATEQKATGRRVKYRVLGKTGLRVSEIGIGGHSWAYKQVPDGQGRAAQGQRPGEGDTQGHRSAGGRSA